MRVEIDLRGDLARRVNAASPGSPGRIELAEGASVADLASALGLGPAAAVFVVNGAAATPRQPLTEGDRVQVFPMAAGG